MLFGMFKEKEVIDNTNLNTANGDIVEDFGGVINNQLNDKDLIPLSSFSESHSEDINYQNIDINNQQQIINSTNNIQQTSGVQNIMNSNYQTQYSQPQNNNNVNYQNISMNNQQQTNPNYISQQYYSTYPNMNMQNVQQTNPVQFGMDNQNVQMYNTPNIQTPTPTQVVQMNTNQIDTNTQNVVSNNIEQPINVQAIDSNVESEDNNILNSPVEILTEVSEKGGRSSLISALLEAAPPQTTNILPNLNTIVESNIAPQQNINMLDLNQFETQTNIPITSEFQINDDEQKTQISNNILNPIDVNNENIVENPVDLQKNVEEQQDNNILPTKEIETQPIVPIPTELQINNNHVEEQETANSDNTKYEHKFIISDNVDVEPGFKICPKCGQKIRDDYRLCFVCGTYF